MHTPCCDPSLPLQIQAPDWGLGTEVTLVANVETVVNQTINIGDRLVISGETSARVRFYQQTAGAGKQSSAFYNAAGSAVAIVGPKNEANAQSFGLRSTAGGLFVYWIERCAAQGTGLAARSGVR